MWKRLDIRRYRKIAPWVLWVETKNTTNEKQHEAWIFWGLQVSLLASISYSPWQCWPFKFTVQRSGFFLSSQHHMPAMRAKRRHGARHRQKAFVFSPFSILCYRHVIFTDPFSSVLSAPEQNVDLLLNSKWWEMWLSVWRINFSSSGMLLKPVKKTTKWMASVMQIRLTLKCVPL